jgi:DNA polymerase-3 subunit beta
MKLIVNRKHFLGLLDRVSSVAASGKVSHEVFKFVRLEALHSGITLQATDGEVIVCVDGDGETESPGIVLVDPSKIATLLKESSAEVISIESAVNGIDVVAGKSKFNLPSQKAEEFPTAKKLSGDYTSVSREALQGLIHRTRFACDVDSTRYQLGGVLVESQDGSLRMVATDGRRLSVVESDAVGTAGGSSAIIPQKGLQTIAKAFQSDAEVRLMITSNAVAVSSETTYVETRLVEGRFPQWQKVLPDTDRHTRISLEAAPFVSLLRQAAVVADPMSRGVDLQFAPGELSVVSSAADRGKVEASMSVDTSANLKATIDARYVLDFAERCGSDEVFDLFIIDGSSPAVFVAGTWRYVVMPMARS